MDTFYDKELISKITNQIGKSKNSQTSNFVTNSMGLNKESAKFAESLEDLRNNPPNIIIASPRKDFTFSTPGDPPQTLKKKVEYVMGLGAFKNLNQNMKDVLKPGNVKFKNIFRPYNGEDLSGKSLLIWRTGGFGDLLFIQPNLIHLKKIYPDSKIIFACGRRYRPLVELWDCVDEIIDLPFSARRLFSTDYHVLFEGLIERCEVAHRENAYRLFTKWMGLNLPDELLVGQLTPSPRLNDECKMILEDIGLLSLDFILFQLKTSSPIRTPSPTLWKSIIDKLTDLGHNIVLTDSQIQYHVFEKFKETLKNQDKVFNFSKYSRTMDFTISLASLSKMVVCPDSALAHIAPALGKKCFGIYGPFLGELRLDTFKDKASWINAKKACAPCFMHGYVPCPNSVNGHSDCFNNIDTDLCVEKILELLKS